MSRFADGLVATSGVLLLAIAATVTAVDYAHPMFNDLPWIGVGFAAFGLLLVPAARKVRLRRIGAAAALLAAPTWLLSAGDSLGPLPARMVILGVDGATWQVIDAEKLPAFQATAEEGARGNLISMEPMFSPLLWTTIASGRSPADHGVRGFHVHSNDCKVARWWDIAEASGAPVGLYKWLVDYPPRAFAGGGFWVPSWLAPTPETWPAHLSVVKEVELANRLRRKAVGQRGASLRVGLRLVRVGVRLSTLSSAGAWMVEALLTEPDESRRNTAMQLIRGDIDRDVFIEQSYVEAPLVASLNYYATDGLAHLYWDRYLAGGDELRSAYRQVDSILAEIRQRLHPEGRLLVVSDHGFKAMDGSGIAGQFLPLTERLSARLATEVVRVDVTRIGHKLVVGTPSPADAARVRAWLATLIDDAGQPFYKAGDFPDDPASVALTLVDERITASRMTLDHVGGETMRDYVTMSAAYTGTHEVHGVFLAWGEGVTAGRLGDVPLLDAAPTLLAGARLPAALDMPGRAHVWTELPRVPSWDGLVPGLQFLDAADQGVNDEMLKALGYVDDGTGSGRP